MTDVRDARPLGYRSALAETTAEHLERCVRRADLSLHLRYAPAIVATTVFIRQLTNGTEANRILDALEAVTGLHGEPVEGGRSYNLDDSRDFVIAMASIKGQLDAISDTWPIHLGMDVGLE